MASGVYPSESRFREVFNLLEQTIERRYEIQVLISDVADPFTGDLDGESIAVDYDQPGEDALFIMVHLFGHTVQWNTDSRARIIGAARTISTDPASLAELRDYELKACRYSLQLLRETGVTDLDQWLADFAACGATGPICFITTRRARSRRSGHSGGRGCRFSSRWRFRHFNRLDGGLEMMASSSDARSAFQVARRMRTMTSRKRNSLGGRER